MFISAIMVYWKFCTISGRMPIGMLLSIWSVVEYVIWGAILGVIMTYLGKSWYLDRMVWLYEDMKDNNDEYRSWNY